MDSLRIWLILDVTLSPLMVTCMCCAAMLMTAAWWELLVHSLPSSRQILESVEKRWKAFKIEDLGPVSCCWAVRSLVIAKIKQSVLDIGSFALTCLTSLVCLDPSLCTDL